MNGSTMSFEDYVGIQKALSTYVIAVDTKTLKLFDECFTPDARIIIAGHGEFGVDAWRNQCENGLGKFDGTQHLLGMPTLHMDGDRASMRTYFIAQHCKNALRPNPNCTIGGWYDCQLVKRDHWRIISHTSTAVWQDGNPSVLGYNGEVGALPQGPTHAAPAWL